jgi:hypothetical protein
MTKNTASAFKKEKHIDDVMLCPVFLLPVEKQLVSERNFN